MPGSLILYLKGMRLVMFQLSGFYDRVLRSYWIRDGFTSAGVVPRLTVLCGFTRMNTVGSRTGSISPSELGWGIQPCHTTVVLLRYTLHKLCKDSGRIILQTSSTHTLNPSM